jgi:4-amino-4-deoxy-L-arabinose transferase-like glycosyltransferase
VSKSQGRNSARLVLAAGLALWLGSALLLWLQRPPLGHDEAQYALAFQGMLRGGPLRWIYLSKGMHAVVAPGVWLGGDELALRALPLVCGVGFALAAAHLAWRVFGATTAGWTLLVLATAKPLVRRSVDLLSDFPSAALLLLGTTIVLCEVIGGGRRGVGGEGQAGAGAGDGGAGETGPSWRLVWAAPVFAAAFYLRYASCVPVAIVGGVALLFGWRGVRRRPGPVVAAVALLAALLVPHLVDSAAITGSPLGVLLESQRVPQAEVSGLRTYLTSNPLSFYGFAVTPVLVLGLDRKSVV